MFDGGIRLSRNAVIDFITAQYAAGKRYENVTEPDVDCLCQSKHHHGHVRNRKTDLDGISLSPEKSRHLEDRLLAQHSGP
jgi:hypothetical protein